MIAGSYTAVMTGLSGPRGSIFAALQLCRERVSCCTRSQNPTDDDAKEQNGGDEDEVTRGHLALLPDRCLRVRNSSSTLARRRHTDHR
jgi:hypothetical protein